VHRSSFWFGAPNHLTFYTGPSDPWCYGDNTVSISPASVEVTVDRSGTDVSLGTFSWTGVSGTSANQTNTTWIWDSKITSSTRTNSRTPTLSNATIGQTYSVTVSITYGSCTRTGTVSVTVKNDGGGDKDPWFNSYVLPVSNAAWAGNPTSSITTDIAWSVPGSAVKMSGGITPDYTWSIKPDSDTGLGLGSDNISIPTNLNTSVSIPNSTAAGKSATLIITASATVNGESHDRFAEYPINFNKAADPFDGIRFTQTEWQVDANTNRGGFLSGRIAFTTTSGLTERSSGVSFDWGNGGLNDVGAFWEREVEGSTVSCGWSMNVSGESNGTWACGVGTSNMPMGFSTTEIGKYSFPLEVDVTITYQGQTYTQRFRWNFSVTNDDDV